MLPPPSVITVVFNVSVHFNPSKINKNYISHQIYQSLPHNTISTDLNAHDLENEQLNEDLYSSQLFKKIVEKYLKIRLYSYSKRFNKDDFTNTRNQEPDIRATKPFELIHTDLAGPVDPVGKDGFRYAMIS